MGMLKWVPNALTAARGLSGPVVMALVFLDAERIGFWWFLGAIATDMVDGWIARRLNATSRIALFLDPLADKLLTDFSWAALAAIGHAPLWLAVVVIGRDLGVGVGWAWGSRRGVSWEPRPAGQISVALEGIALCVLLFHGPWLGVHWPTVGAILGATALALSFVPFVEYAWKPGAAR
jgi:phosphatidylglycerophosphate synthase